MKTRKKLFCLALTLLLALTMVSCSAGGSEDSAETEIVNPVNLTMEIVIGLPNAEEDGFESVPVTAFIAEEGTNVMEATQLFCMADDISISVDADKSYVTEIGGLTEKDYAETTGWIFKVNGEIPTVPADQVIISENDEIRWEFVDFATYSW